MDSEFRYDFRKVLGTQNYSTRESASTHCVLRLNLIKYTFNIAFYTHTHTLAYIKHGIKHPKTLTYIYHTSHIKSSIHLSCILSKQANKYLNYLNRNINMLRSNRHAIAMTRNLQIHQSKIKIIYQANAYSCECMTYLTTPQHLCIDA